MSTFIEYPPAGSSGGGVDTTSIARDGSRPPTATQPWNGQSLTAVNDVQLVSISSTVSQNIDVGKDANTQTLTFGDGANVYNIDIGTLAAGITVAIGADATSSIIMQGQLSLNGTPSTTSWITDLLQPIVGDNLTIATQNSSTQAKDIILTAGNTISGSNVGGNIHVTVGSSNAGLYSSGIFDVSVAGVGHPYFRVLTDGTDIIGGLNYLNASLQSLADFNITTTNFMNFNNGGGIWINGTGGSAPGGALGGFFAAFDGIAAIGYPTTLRPGYICSAYSIDSGGLYSMSGYQYHTANGSSFTITSGVSACLINESSLQSSVAITLPAPTGASLTTGKVATPYPGQVLYVASLNTNVTAVTWVDQAGATHYNLPSTLPARMIWESNSAMWVGL